MKSLTIVLALFSLWAVASACSRREADYLGVIEAYESAHNDYDVDAVMALFTDDAEFELVGQGALPNHEAIRAIHEYDRGIHSQLSFQKCAVEENVVSCEVVEENDWLAAAGLDPIFYPSSRFTLTEEGEIRKIAATVSEEDGAAMAGVLAEFIPWLLAERPEESVLLFTADGQFVYSEANGRLVVELLSEWRAATTGQD